MSYRKWAKIFRKGGATYVGMDGKNHHIWEYAPAGSAQVATAGFPAHSEGADISEVYIKVARRLWRLRQTDGVSDHEFLQGTWR